MSSQIARFWPTAAAVGQMDGSGISYFVYGDPVLSEDADKLFAALRIDVPMFGPAGGTVNVYFQISMDGEKWVSRTGPGETFSAIVKGTTTYPFFETLVLSDLGALVRVVFEFTNSIAGDMGLTPNVTGILRGPIV